MILLLTALSALIPFICCHRHYARCFSFSAFLSFSLSTMYSLVLASLVVRLAVALPHVGRQSSGPVISSNFQDPSVIKVGNTWYAYSGPNGNPNVNVQIATSSDFASWSVHGGVDVLPDPGPWAASPPHVWAPDVNQLVRPLLHQLPLFLMSLPGKWSVHPLLRRQLRQLPEPPLRRRRHFHKRHRPLHTHAEPRLLRRHLRRRH